MADVITRLKLESSEYDSKIKRATQGLLQMEQECRKAGKSLNDMEKDQKQFVQSLGSMQTVSRTTRGKISELSSAFVDLRSQYNRLTDEEKKGDFGKALSGSLDQLKTRVQAAKQELKDIQKELDGGSNASGGWLSGLGGKMSGMMQVFGGNLLTKATMEVANLGAEMMDTVKQGIELARQGEGIRNAFARLGRGDILDGLRQATHGTVTDLELMKAAVKFNDFRLPVEELGTMLAFAQQKAKDTGQSVDYMVDSIVTGLGRKSLMILDNLGLSASEIRERMKETGDMTTAVGAIIREQMSKAGDYVETAADRAAQANVSLQNKMEELGRKFAPVEEASTQLWTSMKIAILDVVSGPLARLLNGLTEAGRLRNQMNDMAGGNSDSETEKQIRFLRNTSAGNRKARYDKQIAIYNTQEANEWRSVNALKAQREAFRREVMRRGARESDQDTYNDFDRQIATHTNRARSWQMFRINYQQQAQGILNPIKPLPPSSDTTNNIPTKTGKGGKTTVKELTEEEKLQQQINDLVQQGMTMDEQGRAAQRVKIAALQDQLQTYKDIENELRGIGKKETEIKPIKPVETAMSKFEGGPTNVQSMQAYLSAMQGEMQKFDLGSEFYNAFDAKLREGNTLSQILQQAMESGVQGANLENVAQTIKDKMLQGGVMNTEQIKALVDEINTSIEDNDLKLKLEIDEKGAVTGVTTQVAEMTKNWKAAGTAISQVGSAMSQIEDPAAKVMGTIAQAIATVALAFSQALLKPKDPWSWIAFAAAGTATMISTIAAIKSATAGSYAEGGIIPGNSFSGDNQWAQVNAGEVILNRSQQGVLAAELESGNRDNGAPTHPYVSGEMIFLGLNNYLRRTGRGEIVTSR